jgi:hypothetical protein
VGESGRGKNFLFNESALGCRGDEANWRLLGRGVDGPGTGEDAGIEEVARCDPKQY